MDFEKHYNKVYKEIIVVENDIKKLEFHPIGHDFVIMLDNIFFPRIMELKEKGVPNKQLLRLNIGSQSTNSPSNLQKERIISFQTTCSESLLS